MAEEKKYWNEEMETMPLNKLKELQDERLQAVVAYAYEKTVFYRRKFDEAGIKPADIRTTEDLKKLPCTEPTEEFRKASLSDRLAVPLEEVKRVASTSGTTALPDIIPFTKNDYDVFIEEGEARARWTMGVRPNDVVQVLTGFQCCHDGYTAVGVTWIRPDVGRGNLDHQIRVANIMGLTVLEHLPSLALDYFERARELGINIKQSKLRLVSGVGEGWAEAYKRRIEAEYGFPFRTLYGNIEAGVVASECEYGKGMHLLSDLIIVEVIDPETQQVLGPGEEGELVITTLLCHEAMPLIRYRMADVASILPYQPCPCGRTHPKISMIKGRFSQMIRIKGQKIFPIDVEEVVASTPGLGNEYQIIVDKPGELDRLKVRVEFEPEVKALGILKKQAEEALNQSLRVDSEVELVPKGSIAHAMFKAQRIVTTY